MSRVTRNLISSITNLVIQLPHEFPNVYVYFVPNVFPKTVVKKLIQEFALETSCKINLSSIWARKRIGIKLGTKHIIFQNLANVL